ncbi:alpha/beta hydrolase-fold protein [Thermodesulfobacteriota bacterium]
MPIQSPVVNADGSVTINFQCGHVNKVDLQSDFRLGQEVVVPIAADVFVPMEKGKDDIWSITTEPVQAGIYRYAFFVDGLKVIDPLNPWMRKAEMGQPYSMVKVPSADDTPQPWDLLPDIRHGIHLRETFFSPTLNMMKRCNIYLPPGYNPSKRYPVFYLLHGGGNDYGHWVFDGTADNIMDFLIAKRQTMELVLVMPDGNVNPIVARSGGRPPTPSPEAMEKAAQAHVDYFVNDLLPFIESKYRADASTRIIAGLSMGCGQTWRLITSKPDLFRTAGLFSGVAADAKEKLSEVIDELVQYQLVFVAVGNRDTPRIIESMQALPAVLDKLKIKHRFFETEGGHIWAVWQRALVEMLTALSLPEKV